MCRRGPPHCSGRGGSAHHGRWSWLIRTTHLTQWKPRRPGTTRRAGDPCPGERLSPLIPVANSSWSLNGSRREYPVALVTSTAPLASGGSSLLRRTPDHPFSAPHPPVQSRTATCRSSHWASLASDQSRDEPPVTTVNRQGAASTVGTWSNSHDVAGIPLTAVDVS